MDTNQEQVVLQAIAASSSSKFGVLSPQDRETAFRILEQFKVYERRLPVCLTWIQQDQIIVNVPVLSQQSNNANNDRNLMEITVPTKLFALEIIHGTMDKSYGSLNDGERLALRHAVLLAARQLAPLHTTDEARILGNKIALILARLSVRDFPQRWTNFVQDLFSSTSEGGLWNADAQTMHELMGIKICLECLKIITEDCTDGDFNSKVSFRD
jgi:hypothetical protein